MDHLPFPLAEIVVLVRIEDRGGFFASLLYSTFTRLNHRGLFLFSLFQVFDAPQSNLGLAVLDLVHINPAFVQGVAK